MSFLKTKQIILFVKIANMAAMGKIEITEKLVTP